MASPPKSASGDLPPPPASELQGASEGPAGSFGEESDEEVRDRVLVAEDNDLLGEHVSRILSPHWEVILCRDGREALEATLEQRPDLVLSDVMMPGLDGIQLCERIKQNPDTREIPVVLVTALGEIEDRLRGFDAGADEYVTKPFAARELVARLRVLLELRRTRRRLERYAAGLERLVDAQVGHILEKNQQLTRANRQMEDFLAVAAHDLRSPLVSIHGFVDLIRDHLPGEVPGEVQQALERIHVNIEWMTSLTSRLLSLSTVHGEREDRRVVELAGLFRRVATRTREAAEREGGEMQLLAGELRLPVDPVHLEEALVNLVENAAKYRSPERPLRLQLRCEAEPVFEEEGGEPFLEIVVEDNGRGIPERDQVRVFEPLVRLESGVGQGAGLGLHIVRRVVEDAGGRVWIESEVGEGTRVHLRLPATLLPELESALEEQQADG